MTVPPEMTVPISQLSDTDLLASRLVFFFIPVGHRFVYIGDTGFLVQVMQSTRHQQYPVFIAVIAAMFAGLSILIFIFIDDLSTS